VKCLYQVIELFKDRGKIFFRHEEYEVSHPMWAVTYLSCLLIIVCDNQGPYLYRLFLASFYLPHKTTLMNAFPKLNFLARLNSTSLRRLGNAPNSTFQQMFSKSNRLLRGSVQPEESPWRGLGVIELPSIPPSANMRGIPRSDSSSSFKRGGRFIYSFE